MWLGLGQGYVARVRASIDIIITNPYHRTPVTEPLPPNPTLEPLPPLLSLTSTAMAYSTLTSLVLG